MKEARSERLRYRRGLFAVSSDRERDYLFDLAGGVLAIIVVFLGSLLVAWQATEYIIRHR